MRYAILSGLLLSLFATLTGCGDSGGSTTTASSAGAPTAPPPPPSAGRPPPPSAPPAPTENPAPAPSDVPPTGGDPPGTEPQPAPAPPIEAPSNPPPEPAPAGDVPAAPKPKTLRERAMTAFHEGKDDEAFKMLATHYLFALDSGDELVQKMQWVHTLRRPTLAARFDVVVVYTAPKEFDGHPQPIGSAEAAASFNENSAPAGDNGNGLTKRGVRRPNDAGGDAPAAAVATVTESTNPAINSLARYTGEVGTLFVAGLKAKMETGALGATLQEAVAPLAAAVDPNNPNPVAAIPAPAGGENKSQSHPGQLLPAVMFLGVTDEKELPAVLKKSTADGIVIFEVTVRPARAISFVNNTVKMRITIAKDNKVIFTSSPLNNYESLVERKKRGAKLEDAVNVEVNQAITHLEKMFAMGPLPEGVTAEVAKKHINDLAKEKPQDPFPMMLEARYYVAKGLMTQADMMTIAVEAFGEDKVAQLMQQLQGGDLGALVNKVLADPNIGKILEGQDPAKLLKEAGKGEAADLLNKLFPKGAPPAVGDKPADEKPAP